MPAVAFAQGVPESPLPEAGEQAPGVLAITNAHIHPVTSAPIPDGTLLMEDGQITAVGDEVTVPEGARVVDAEGRHVMPGIVESHSHMGFKQLWKPGTGGNNNELYRSINARTRAEDGLNAYDVGFEKALAAGVTTKNITPGSRSPNSGQAVVTKLRAQTIEEMKMAHGGMKFAIRVPQRSSTFDGTEEEVRGLLRSRFLDAQAYLEQRASGEARRDLTLEAFGKLLEREWPVGVHAHGAEAMRQAARLKEEFNLDLYVHHGEAIGEVSDEFLRLDIPVSFGIVLPYHHWHHSDIEGAVEFVERGGLLAFHQDHPDGPQYYLRETAALFVRNGMPEREAMRALTINGARILGLEDRVGSLEEGKDADVLVLDGPPLDWESRVHRVFVEGREVYRLSEEKRALRRSSQETASRSPSETSTSADVREARATTRATPSEGDVAEADMAVVGGEIRTVSGETIPEGTILIEDGTIAAVGADLEVPEEARVIDAEGLVVTPGLLDARSTLGPSRPGAGESTAARTSAREDHSWLRDGVTATYAAPTDREPIGGLGGVVKLAGPEGDRLVRERAGLNLSLRERALGGGPTTRQGAVGMIRQRLIDAEAEGDPDLSPALEGEVPVRVAAHAPDDILTALRLAREFDLELVVDLASGAHRVADHLAEADVPVVAGPSIVGHGGGGPYEKFADTPWNAGQLVEAGVPVAFSTNGSGGRSVAVEALVGVGHGLSPEQALRATTLEAAQILGVEDQLGSIEPGKDADLVLWEGEPVSTWGEARQVLVGGEMVLEEGAGRSAMR